MNTFATTSDNNKLAPVDATGRSIHRGLTLALQLIMLIGLGVSIYEQQWLNIAAISGILLLTALPMLILRRLEIYIPPEFELFTIGFIFAALFLGETQDFYGRFWWWDLALHTTSGVLLGILGFLLVYVLNETPRLDVHMQPGFVAFFAFCFAVTVGALWEVFEFAMDRLAGTTMQKQFLGDPSGLTDTMWDLIVDALGALAVALAGYLYMKRGMTSFIVPWIQRFIAGNPRLFKRWKGPATLVPYLGDAAPASTRMRKQADTSLPPQTAVLRGIMTEAEIDEILAGSFPASDPPSWTLGINRRTAKENDYEKQTQPN